jgi:DNA mismatch endonuclease (patch repair protein)
MHNCPRAQREPKTNAEYWRKKRQSNADRDARTQKALKKIGWKPVVVWECELRDADALSRRINSKILGRGRRKRKQ